MTKDIARSDLRYREVVSFAQDSIRLQYTENGGAFLSLGASLPSAIKNGIFIVGVGVVLTALLGYLLFTTSLNRYTTIALTLICAGGFGNLIDRILYDGYVVDFLNIGVGGLRTGIFNVADIAITTGAIALIIYGGIRRNHGQP